MGVRFTGETKGGRKICRPAGAACQPNLECRVDFSLLDGLPHQRIFFAMPCNAVATLTEDMAPQVVLLYKRSFFLFNNFISQIQRVLVLYEISAKVIPTHRPVLQVVHRALQPDLPPLDGSEVPGSTRATAEEGHRVA